MLIPTKVLKLNDSTVGIFQQFKERITKLNFSEIPSIDSLKQTLIKEKIQTSNEIIVTKNDLKKWSIELDMKINNKHLIWSNSISNDKLECIFIGTENDSVQNKAKLAKIIASRFGQLLYFSMTGEGFIIENNEDADTIETKYRKEFEESREWKQKL